MDKSRNKVNELMIKFAEFSVYIALLAVFGCVFLLVLSFVAEDVKQIAYVNPPWRTNGFSILMSNRDWLVGNRWWFAVGMLVYLGFFVLGLKRVKKLCRSS